MNRLKESVPIVRVWRVVRGVLMFAAGIGTVVVFSLLTQRLASQNITIILIVVVLAMAITVMLIDGLVAANAKVEADRYRAANQMTISYNQEHHSVRVTPPRPELNRAGADLRGADMSLDHLEQANLEGANLQGANLENAYLEGANLSKANLQGANLDAAHLEDAVLKEANLQDAQIRITYLQANLSGADLRRANVSGSLLCYADLSGADLSGTNLRNSCLERAKMVGAILDATEFDEDTTLPDETKWTPETDMARFTDPHHPDFWSPEEA